MQVCSRLLVTASATAGVALAASTVAAERLLEQAGKNAAPTTAASERTGVVTAIDVTNVPSVDFVASPSNFVMFLQIGAGNGVNGIGWDVVLQTNHPHSLLSDIAVLVTTSAGSGGFFVRPGLDAIPGGPTHYDSAGQILKLANYTIPDVIAMGDGLIRLEFFDYVDDSVGVLDAQWLSGSLFLQTYAPIPSTSTMSLLALAGIAGLRRRRKR